MLEITNQIVRVGVVISTRISQYLSFTLLLIVLKKEMQKRNDRNVPGNVTVRN